MREAAIAAGRAVVTVSVRDRLTAGLNSAAKKLTDFGRRTRAVGGAASSAVSQIGGQLQSGMSSIGSGFEQVGLRIGLVGAGMSAASAAVLTPMRSMVMEFSSVGDAVHKFAVRMGMSGEAITQMSQTS